MDVSIKEWGSYRRRFPSTFPLILMDFIPQKRHWIRHAFGTCNFSFILRGRGEYRRLGRTWAVEAPCVLTQLPGERLEYGPLVPEQTWDELYLMYDARLLPEFCRQRLIDPDRPVWPIANQPAVEARVSELLSVCASPTPAQVADCVDRLCELLILETHLQSGRPSVAADDAFAIRQIERELAAKLDRPVDLEDLVQRHGMSLSTFRRRWAQAFNVSPTRYRASVRLREACRLLAQTDKPVYEIARIVGFPDQLYFSRRFHQELKVSPRAYRRMYQVHDGRGHTP